MGNTSGHRINWGYLLACCLCVLVLGANAQHRAVHLLLASDAQVLGTKMFHAVIHEMDPGAQLSVQDDRVKVMIDNAITADQLVERLQVRGMGSFTVLIDGSKAQRQQQDDLPEGFPTRIDTGDPATDEANYQQAKEAWIQAHPDAYDQLNLLDEEPALRQPQSMEE